MKKLFIALTLIVTLVTTMSVCFAQEIEQPEQYTAQMFSDVSEDAWYAEYVEDVYEYGFLSGTADGIMSPDGKVTVAQAVTAAARVHAAFDGTYQELESASDGANWYDKYVNYASNNGIIQNGQFDDVNRNITRIETACLLYDAAGPLSVINENVNVPDLANGKEGADKVISLYKAGVITGNDEYGYFMPELEIKRSELCTMISRIADNVRRSQDSLTDVGNRALGDAYYIMESLRPVSTTTGLANAWKYDNRFSYLNETGTYSNTISDSSNARFYSLIREFKAEDEGLVHLELVLDSVRSGNNGVYFAFKDTQGDTVLNVTAQNGVWVAQGLTTAASTVQVDNMMYNKLVVEVYIDLDNNTASVVLDNSAPVQVNIDDANITTLVLGTTKEGVGAFTFLHARMAKNYAINEHFLAKDALEGQTPQGWDVTGNFAFAKMAASTYVLQDPFSLKSTTSQGSTSTAYKEIETIAGNVRLEAFVLLPTAVSGAKIALMDGESEEISLVSRGSDLYYGNTKVHTYEPNTWISVRINADTKTGKANIIINGKQKATVDFTATSFDGFKAEFAPNATATMWIDDIDLYNYTEYSDYVPEPVVSSSDDYNVGMHVCNLWRDTTANEGWDVLSAFEEFDPYLGYYDEGLEEVADWETKWMVEHGVDFMHVCWYPTDAYSTTPIKTPRNMQALNTGYMNSRYSDDLDFCIMWENAYSTRTTLTNFKENIWKYWVEYYFKDERYVRLDNKALLTVWDYDTLVSAFGSTANVKLAVDFMDAELKKLGYDGVIFLVASHGLASASTIQEMTSLGIDGEYPYHWHRPGYDADYQIERNATYSSHFAANGSHHVPIASIGFNDVARNKVRSPIITTQGFAEVCQAIKTTLSNYNTNTWKDNTLFISSWNEFSEGTYIAPTASTGFKYLDIVRKVFTNDTSDHSAIDVKPSQRSLDRTSHMYPENHAIIRYLQTQIPGSGIVQTLPASVWKSGRTDVTLTVLSDGSMKLSSTSQKDMNISTKTAQSINASDVSAIKVKMKSNVSSYAKLYFTTSASPSWDEAKTITITPVQASTEYVDYYFDMSENDYWTGTVTSLRFDPIEVTGGGEVYIESIELLGGDFGTVYVNGTEFEPTFSIAKTQDGDYELFAMQEDAAFAKLRLFYEYDRVAGKITLHSYNEKTLVLTAGSNTAILDGRQVDLGYTFSFFDGLPVLHLKKICNLLGYAYTESNGVLNITAATPQENQTTFANQWEFLTGSDFDGWKAEGTAVLDSIEDGFVVFYSEGRDPKMTIETDFNASDYSKIEIGVKNSANLASMRSQIYFKTESSNEYSEDKSFVFYFSNATVRDGIAKITLNCSSKTNWSGTITGLRFDPFDNGNGGTSIEIDYIKCIPA